MVYVVFVACVGLRIQTKLFKCPCCDPRQTLTGSTFTAANIFRVLEQTGRHDISNEWASAFICFFFHMGTGSSKLGNVGGVVISLLPVHTPYVKSERFGAR